MSCQNSAIEKAAKEILDKYFSVDNNTDLNSDGICSGSKPYEFDELGSQVSGIKGRPVDDLFN